MFGKTVESPENQGAQGLFQHFRGLLKEKILLKFLPKSEGAIASPTPLAPTTLLIDKENTNDLDSTADPCQKEDETLVKAPKPPNPGTNTNKSQYGQSQSE